MHSVLSEIYAKYVLCGAVRRCLSKKKSSARATSVAEVLAESLNTLYFLVQYPQDSLLYSPLSLRALVLSSAFICLKVARNIRAMPWLALSTPLALRARVCLRFDLISCQKSRRMCPVLWRS